MKYSNQCCVRRKPWTWPSTRNTMQTTSFKIVNNYWNTVALDGNPWTYSNTRNRMQTTKFKIINANQGPRCIYIRLKMVVRPKHVADNLSKIVNNSWSTVSLHATGCKQPTLRLNLVVCTYWSNLNMHYNGNLVVRACEGLADYIRNVSKTFSRKSLVWLIVIEGGFHMCDKRL
jgi:hypothetical protein